MLISVFRLSLRVAAMSALAGAAMWQTGCGRPDVVSPRPVFASEPVPVNEVDDGAVWLHPTDPTKSLLLLANERRGLEVHECDGMLMKNVDDGLRPNNVDLLYDVETPTGRVDLALAACFAPDRLGVKVWRIDPEKRKLYDATDAPILKAFDGTAPLGLCTYHSRKTGRSYFFVSNAKGAIEQHELVHVADGRFTSKVVRNLNRTTKVEGCVADEERGVVFFAEEDVGVWRYDAEPDASTEGTCVIRVGEHGLIPDVEGLALYCTSKGGGYLLVVSQGPKNGHCALKVYERGGDNKYVLTIVPSAQPWGPVERASGLVVTNRPTIARFSRGFLGINDHLNIGATEDFKLYAWDDIARPAGLEIDTSWSPRAEPALKK